MRTSKLTCKIYLHISLEARDRQQIAKHEENEIKGRQTRLLDQSESRVRPRQIQKRKRKERGEPEANQRAGVRPRPRAPRNIKEDRTKGEKKRVRGEHHKSLSGAVHHQPCAGGSHQTPECECSFCRSLLSPSIRPVVPPPNVSWCPARGICKTLVMNVNLNYFERGSWPSQL